MLSLFNMFDTVVFQVAKCNIKRLKTLEHKVSSLYPFGRSRE